MNFVLYLCVACLMGKQIELRHNFLVEITMLETVASPMSAVSLPLFSETRTLHFVVQLQLFFESYGGKG